MDSSFWIVAILVLFGAAAAMAMLLFVIWLAKIPKHDDSKKTLF